MNIEILRTYCLSLHNTTESFPFGPDILVFKVEEKMFGLIPLDGSEPSFTLKCDPEQVIILRDRYCAVEPAFHFNKRYWNTIYLNRDMPSEDILRWVNHSYAEVIAKLPKRTQALYAEYIKHD
jgi:predicted DNA-binding protein (MmcQ/YjbR family)